MENIPLLKDEILDKFHFGNVAWQLPFKNVSHEFHINELADIKNFMHFPLPPHRKAIYDIIFLTKGKAIRSKGLNKYEFEANQVFILPAYQITTHEYLSPDAEGYYMHFDSGIFNNFEIQFAAFPFLAFSSNPIINIPESDIESILNIFERLKILHNIEKPNLGLISLYVLVLFEEFIKYENRTVENYKNSANILTQKYKEALSTKIHELKSVFQYADLLCVTPNHLNKCVKKSIDKSAQELLNEMQILEAKSLLKYTNLPIAEIALKILDQNSSNFARFFKKKTGMLPKDFKH